MFSKITTTASDYLHFYRDWLAEQWNHVTPPQYLAILIGIFVCGWLLMKSVGHKRPKLR